MPPPTPLRVPMIVIVSAFSLDTKSSMPHALIAFCSDSEHKSQNQSKKLPFLRTNCNNTKQMVFIVRLCIMFLITGSRFNPIQSARHRRP